MIRKNLRHYPDLSKPALEELASKYFSTEEMEVMFVHGMHYKFVVTMVHSDDITCIIPTKRDTGEVAYLYIRPVTSDDLKSLYEEMSSGQR